MIEVSIICAICDKADPQTTRGCDRTDCQWRFEAMIDIVRDGGAMHAICDKTNNSEQDIAEGRMNIRFEAWRKPLGCA